MAEFGYSPFELRKFDFPLAGIDTDTLNARYLCNYRGDQHLNFAPERRIITTGFGMSGVPHLATVAQILKIIELQRGGERCQIVLGDLDAYNGKVRSFSQVRALADDFEEYVLRLGFDPARGTVRAQDGHHAALEAMYLIGRYVDQRDFDRAEEDNHSYYAAQGVVDSSMTFRRALSLCLMAADFIALGQTHDAVLVTLGIDEHKYVRFATDVCRRLDEESPLRTGFTISAAYTRMVRGFGGHPKFSKSIPGSAIDMTSTADQVRTQLLGEPPLPAVSATYQLMCELPCYTVEDLRDLHKWCIEGGRAWQLAVLDLADYVIDLIGKWPATATARNGE
ncbi:hypothetical protein B8W66_06970 [Mycobacterium decipiens]|uniref:Tryptophan--tRNA ligase n=1 Tax=Mycobacterium decipiens TaxID=1430326 RepID=A0A1X2LXM3_9MYCO|nr:hypothetical protein B8W66_06970 [Mycobacterium decipiens]